MGLPIATKEGGICFAFPDVCNTPSPGGPVPIPYPNIGQLSEAEKCSSKVRIGGKEVILQKSEIPSTKGDEAGADGGVNSGGTVSGKVTFKTASESVKINGEFVVRMTDETLQNNGNARGIVLGGVSTVRCG